MKTSVGAALSFVRALATKEGRWYLMLTLNAYGRRRKHTCPCCGYVGVFTAYGTELRITSMCPRCGSLERHRLLALAHQRGSISFEAKEILHFAPEEVIGRIIDKSNPKRRLTADIQPGRAGMVLDITAIDMPEDSFDVVIANHILEHVDDGKALAELKRVIRPGGHIITMIPIVEGWAVTYENDNVATELDRELHYGQSDHIRYYGADFRTRIAATGLKLQEFTAQGSDCVEYRLQRGEKVFVLSKD